MDAHQTLRARRASGRLTARQTSCGTLVIESPTGEPTPEEPTPEEPAGGGPSAFALLVVAAIGLAAVLGGRR